MPPHEFIGIQLRRIRRQRVHMQARMLNEEARDNPGSMRESAIPEQHHMASQMTQKMAKELNDLESANILVRVKATV